MGKQRVRRRGPFRRSSSSTSSSGGRAIDRRQPPMVKDVGPRPFVAPGRPLSQRQRRFYQTDSGAHVVR